MASYIPVTAPVSNPACVVIPIVHLGLGRAQYDTSYSPLLNGRISETEFHDAITRINKALTQYSSYFRIVGFGGMLVFAALAMGIFIGFASGAGPGIFALFFVIVAVMITMFVLLRLFASKQLTAVESVIQDINQQMASKDVRWKRRSAYIRGYSQNIGNGQHHGRARNMSWLEIELGPVAPSYQAPPVTYQPHQQPPIMQQPPVQPYYPYPNTQYNQPLLSNV